MGCGTATTGFEFIRYPLTEHVNHIEGLSVIGYQLSEEWQSAVGGQPSAIG